MPGTAFGPRESDAVRAANRLVTSSVKQGCSGYPGEQTGATRCDGVGAVALESRKTEPEEYEGSGRRW